MKRKIFSLFLCSMVLTGGLVSCRTDKSTADTSLSSSTVEETTEAATDQVAETEYNTMKPPEEGWTIETIAPTIRLCGKSIELPFTIGSLGEDFKFRDNTGIVTYSGCEAFITAFKKNENIDDPYSKTIRKIASCEYYNDDNFQNFFTINGIGIGSDKESVIAAFGQPDFQTDTAFEYYSNHKKSDNYLVRFSFGDLNIVQSAFVNLNNE